MLEEESWKMPTDRMRRPTGRTARQAGSRCKSYLGHDANEPFASSVCIGSADALIFRSDLINPSCRSRASKIHPPASIKQVQR
jgi:hypothetical protein